jgi:hypothetical protein
MMRRGREETPVRLRRIFFGTIALIVLVGPTARAACRTHPDLVGPCFHVRGRAALYNGNPTVRIWKVGTRRLLGVSDRRCQAPDCEPLPAALRALLSWDHPVFGDFELCPFTRARPGVMQFVCVAAASHMRPATPSD